MPETTDPREAPFTALRLPVTPLAPRPGFADELRRQLAARLAPTPTARPTAIAQEAAMSTTETDRTAVGSTALPTLIPYLAVHDGAAAIDWYRDVLGAVEILRYVGDDGRVGHAELVIGPAHLYLADEYPEIDVVGPIGRGGSSVTLHLQVVDVDHTYRQAEAGGATGLRAPADQDHGNRTATLTDPFGHRWMLSQPVDAQRSTVPEETPAADDGPAGGPGWTVTGRNPVEPGYLVLHTADLDRAQVFFGALFDWNFEVGGAGGGHVENTRFPLGLAPPGDDAPERLATPSATTVYFRVDDIDLYATRVAELGGQVLLRTDYPSGGNAECVDDQGYRFDLWKPAPGY